MRYHCIAVNLKHQGCAWLIKSGQVKEITVMPIRKFTIAIAQLFWRCGEDGYSATGLLTNTLGQLGAALAVEISLKDREVTWDHRIDLARINAVVSLHRATDRYIFHRRPDFWP